MGVQVNYISEVKMGHRTTKTNHKVKVHKTVSCRVDFFYYAFRNVLLISVPATIVFALILSLPRSSARVSSSDNLAISVPSSCTLSSSVDETHSASIVNGTYEDNIGRTTLTTFCNDKNGYSVYAIGDSLNSEGNNTLAGSNGSNISSGTATSGDTSNWAMKLSLKAGDTSTTPPSIIDPFTNYSTVPTYWTRVATIPASTTDMEKGSSFTTTYATYISPTQAAGTYLGQVKYLLTYPSTVPPERAYIMQKVASWENDLDEGESVQAIDIRDGKNYWVTKLKDGNIWMTQNLDLEIGGTNTAPLNSNNTDISTTASGSGIYTDGYTEKDGVWTWNPVSTATTSNYYISGTSVKPSAWPTNNYTTPYSAEGGNTYYYTSNTTADDTRYNSLQACKDASHTEDECERYFAGNYYNWSAAIASNNSTNIGSTVGEIASNSICPKGWRLPNASQTDNVNNEFGRMLYGEGITAALSNGNESVGYHNGVTSFNKLRSDPYYFVRSGFIDGRTLYSPGAFGFYWSSTVSSSANAYYLSFSGTNIYPAYNGNRYSGWSVRCVAR